MDGIHLVLLLSKFQALDLKTLKSQMNVIFLHLLNEVSVHFLDALLMFCYEIHLLVEAAINLL